MLSGRLETITFYSPGHRCLAARSYNRQHNRPRKPPIRRPYGRAYGYGLCVYIPPSRPVDRTLSNTILVTQSHFLRSIERHGDEETPLIAHDTEDANAKSNVGIFGIISVLLLGTLRSHPMNPNESFNIVQDVSSQMPMVRSFSLPMVPSLPRLANWAMEVGSSSLSCWLFARFNLLYVDVLLSITSRDWHSRHRQYGKLSDLYGRKSTLITAYTLFAIGCLLWYVGLRLMLSFVRCIPVVDTIEVVQVKPFGK